MNASLLIGKILLVFSTVIWISGLALVPFLPLKLASKAWLAGTCIVIGEVTFYISAFLLGKEIIKKYRKYLNPREWFKRVGEYFFGRTRK